MKKIIPLIFIVMYSCIFLGKNKRSKNIIHYKDFQEIIKEETQFFKISFDDKEKIRIEGSEGTIITFNKYCFENLYDTIVIELKEYYDLPSMVFSKLSTVSNEELLETSGMIFIDVKTMFGKKILLKSKYTVEFPVKKKDENIKIFEGVTENQKSINWILSTDTIETDTSKVKLVLRDPSFDSVNKIFEKITINSNLSFFGWINCDVYSTFEESSNLSVTLEDYHKGMYFSLILYERKSIIDFFVYENDSKMEFNNIPRGEKAILLGIGVKDGKISYSMKNIVFNKEKINFKADVPKGISEEHLRMKLEKKIGGLLYDNI